MKKFYIIPTVSQGITLSCSVCDDSSDYALAGAQIVAAGMNTYGTIASGRQSYKYTKRLNEQAYKRNLQMWHAQNAYNSPGAQMIRLSAAGLNPNLLYGNNQAVSAGQADAAPELQYDPVKFQAPYFDANGLASTVLTMRQQKLQERYNDSVIRLNDAKAITEAGKAATLEIQNANLDEQIKTQIKQMLQSIKESESREQVNWANVGKIEADEELSRLTAWYYPEVVESKLALEDAQLRLSEARIEEVNSILRQNAKELQLMDANMRKIYQEITSMVEGDKLTAQQVKESEQRVKNLKEENRLIGKKIGLTDKDITFYEYNHAHIQPFTSGAYFPYVGKDGKVHSSFVEPTENATERGKPLPKEKPWWKP